MSGGQTGVDRGALDGALDMGIDTGGWCPPDRNSEDGPIPEKYPLLETPVERSVSAPDVPRSLRTEWNVRDSDATLILEPVQKHTSLRGTGGDAGTLWTRACCRKMNKPMLVCDPFHKETPGKIHEWLNEVRPEILNVAGPNEGDVPGIQKAVRQVIYDLLRTGNPGSFRCGTG